MPTAKLKRYLDDRHVRYVSIAHSPAYTSQELAATMHVHGSELAKTTIVKTDRGFVMAVLAGPNHVDLERLRRCVGAGSASLASEKEFKDLFPECELGAMPPFGNLYGLPVYVDQDLERDPSIVFNAGTHTEAIRMDLEDFKRLVEPMLASFSRH